MSGWRDEKQRIPRTEAVKYVELLHKEMSGTYGQDWEICGSWRRGAETIGDFDILVITETGTFAGVREVLPISFMAEHEGPQVIQGKLYTTIPGPNPPRMEYHTQSPHGRPEPYSTTETVSMNCDWYACTPDQRGAALMFLTGPKALNIVQRAWAKKIGYKLSQYGLFSTGGKDRHDIFIAAETEKEVYTRLGLEWIHPLDREKYVEAKPPDDAAQKSWIEKSDSDPNKRYRVTRIGEGADASWSCRDAGTGAECMAFKYRHSRGKTTCKHIDRVKAKL